MNNNTIWMNVTTSAHWYRPPVGIVRVEQSLCAELKKKYGLRFKLCIWEDGKFVAYDYQQKPTLTEKKNKLLEDNETALEIEWIFPLVTKKSAIKLIAQGLLSLAPSGVRPYLNRWLSGIKKILFSLKSVARRMCEFKFRKQAIKVESVHESVHNASVSGNLFSSGDVLISIGLDWDKSFYKKFYFLRKELGVKVVTCCYDLIPVLYPQYCVGEVANIFTSYFLDIADGSDMILCISKQTEKDLIRLMDTTGGPQVKTKVFPLGDSVPLCNDQKISNDIKVLKDKPFILFVSSIERRKNHEILYKAYHLLCKDGHKSALPKLVFVGMQGWGVGDLMNDIRLDPLTSDLIVQLNHVTDGELYHLYKSSLFCVFPSFYEGWGLPVAEALSMGKAVIASNQGSLPEVGRDLVQYVDPWCAREWANALLKMSTDDLWRRYWEDKVTAEYKQRSWQDAAQIVSTAIDEI